MIINMYITLMPVILAGIMNMIFTKTSIYKKYRSPIDCNKKLKDGKRIFGDNKTWIGFFSMIIFGSLSQILWGIVCKIFFSGRNYLYLNVENTILNNILIGAILGATYEEVPSDIINEP